MDTTKISSAAVNTKKKKATSALIGESFCCHQTKQEKIRGQGGSSRFRPWDMSIPLKLFLAISLERKSVYFLLTR